MRHVEASLLCRAVAIPMQHVATSTSTSPPFYINGHSILPASSKHNGSLHRSLQSSRCTAPFCCCLYVPPSPPVQVLMPSFVLCWNSSSAEYQCTRTIARHGTIRLDSPCD